MNQDLHRIKRRKKLYKKKSWENSSSGINNNLWQASVMITDYYVTCLHFSFLSCWVFVFWVLKNEHYCCWQFQLLRYFVIIMSIKHIKRRVNIFQKFKDTFPHLHHATSSPTPHFFSKKVEVFIHQLPSNFPSLFKNVEIFI